MLHIVLMQLKATFCLPIIGVKKNPQSPMYTQLGVITKGTVIEVSTVVFTFGAGKKDMEQRSYEGNSLTKNKKKHESDCFS